VSFSQRKLALCKELHKKTLMPSYNVEGQACWVHPHTHPCLMLFFHRRDRRRQWRWFLRRYQLWWLVWGSQAAAWDLRVGTSLMFRAS
jgi:hypothetical protein